MRGMSRLRLPIHRHQAKAQTAAAQRGKARRLSASLLGVGIALLLLGMLVSTPVFAHGVAEGDKGYIQEISGVHLIPFVYLGAKHMVTGYDHLLFLFGVIFFLYRLEDIGLYVSLFAIGHSITMLFGVLYGVSVSAYLIDAIIGFSVVYKALDNLGASRPRSTAITAGSGATAAPRP